MKPLIRAALAAVLAVGASPVLHAAKPPMALKDVFDIEYANDPRISPDGERVVYVRTAMDIMTDRARGTLWTIDVDGSGHEPLVTGDGNFREPRWSPTGDRLAYLHVEDGKTALMMRWMETGQTARLAQLTERPSGLVWSPDGRQLAFSMLVRARPKPMVELPKKPDGAEWAEPARVIDTMVYRVDGRGYLEPGYTHLFVVPAEGGTPRQVTDGDFNHSEAPSWSPDGSSLVFSANRHDNWEYEPANSEVYEVDINSGEITQITDRFGPDSGPVVSPDGSRIAYLGFDDELKSHRTTHLYVMNRDGSGPRKLTGNLDRGIANPVWDANGRGVFVQYDDAGNTRLARVGLDGKVTVFADNLGGTYLTRPYASGMFTVAPNGRFAYTVASGIRPADVATGTRRGTRRLTGLNEDSLGHLDLPAPEERWVPSSHDDLPIHYWVVKPPGFDPAKQYPMIMEIHGGPHAGYGDRFASEIQLFAAAGYVVVYANPRGSTGYGEEFAQLIHHAYPGTDYDDLMSVVDAVVAEGYVDENQLFVTGGSGGGVLTAWIVGKTDRFAGAVVSKPVINWYSFVLTADLYNFFYKYWFSDFPWNSPQEYLERSPLSLVGNVTTPTMVLTGEDDYRTPMSESEQYYQALRLRKVDTALVRVPGAAHGIAARPSHLMSKVAHILAWFERYRDTGEDRLADGS